MAEHEPTTPAPGRRSRVADRGRRRVNPVLLLSFGIPLATVAALATVRPGATTEPVREPTTAPLTRTVLVCPEALPGTTDVQVAVADPDTGGTLRVIDGEGLVVEPGAVASAPRAATTVLRADAEMAPGLVAARHGSGTSVACSAPRGETWFTGVGAGPEHSSRLRLVNPDAGPAVADIRVLTATGEREVADLRGLAVRANGETEIDLAAVMPERRDVSVHVRVHRGRLVPSVVDRVAEIGGGPAATGWLPGQESPATSSYLLGVGRGGGERTLVVANPGTDETLVHVAAVTPDSEFSPRGLEPVAVPGGSTVTVGLGRFLSSEAAADVVGLRLRSDQPVGAQVRTRRDRSLTHAVASPLLRGSGATVLADGAKELVLAGAEKVTDVVVRRRTAAGRELEARTVTLRPGTSQRVELEPAARWVQVELSGVGVHAAVRTAGTVRPLAEAPTVRLVPHVGPALQ